MRSPRSQQPSTTGGRANLSARMRQGSESTGVLELESSLCWQPCWSLQRVRRSTQIDKKATQRNLNAKLKERSRVRQSRGRKRKPPWDARLQLNARRRIDERKLKKLCGVKLRRSSRHRRRSNVRPSQNNKPKRDVKKLNAKPD